MDSNGPHVLACRKGEGPPMAPKGWRWFTGKRAKDICFVSPSGDRFRSRITLRRYLATIPDGPSAQEFMWMVRPTDFKNLPLPGVEKKHHADRNLRSLVKEIQNRGRPQKSKLKIQQLQNLQQNKRIPIVGDSFHDDSITEAQGDVKRDALEEVFVSQGQKRKRSLRHKSKVCHFCGPLGHGTENDVAAHSAHGPAVKQKGSMNYHCLTSIPDEEKISTDLFKGNNKKEKQSVEKHAACLHEAAEVLQKFLVETGELTENRDIQIDDLRRILLDRSFTRESMKAFPKSVLSALVLLLRNEEAPSALGRRALVRFCTKWYCKHKRFWCLLEEYRIRSVVEKFLTDTSVLERSTRGQSKLETLKDHGMNDPFSFGQYLQNHTSADSQPEGLLKMKIDGIMESSETVEQYEGACYRDRPCKDCKDYQMIKGAFTNFVDDQLGVHKGQENESDDCYDHSKMEEGCIGSHSILPAAKNKDVELLFPSPNKNGISEEIFLAHKIQNWHSCVNLCDEADAKYESPSTHERASNMIVTHGHGSNGDLFDVKIRTDTADHTQVENNCLEKKGLGNADKNSSAKHGGAVETAHCNCKSCSTNVNFCSGCMCYICQLSIHPKETWSYIKCCCHHIFHLECIIKERIGGVVKEQNIDGEFFCPVCSVKYDLFPFWRERLQNASETKLKDILQKHLRSAINAMNGTRRKRLKTLHHKVVKVYISAGCTACSDLQQLLVSILEDVKMQKILKSLDGCLDKSLQIKEIDLFEGEKLVRECQEIADRDLEVYRKAQDLVAIQKKLLAQAQENMKKAEVEMQLAYEQTKYSGNAAKKAKNRLELLKLYYKPEAVTKDQVEIQRKLYEWEVSELRRIQSTMGNLNCCCEESLPELSLLVESVKEQKEKVEVALKKMKKMVALCDS